MFDPKTNKFPYPLDTASHYLKTVMNRGFVFDENYPYVDNSKKAIGKRKRTRFLLYILVFPVIAIRMGLKIKGRRNLKIYKDVLKNGVISVCNHVHMCDYISVMNAIRPYKSSVLVWAPNINDKSGLLIRSVGGIPIPEESMKATRKYLSDVKEYLNNHGWLHIYSEGSMWEYYQPIRPFKKGAAYFAVKCDKPILPLAYSYRKPGFIRRVIFKQIACFTITIGEPIYRNKELPEAEQILDLTKRCHEEVCKLAGIEEGTNIYPPIYEKNQRIDYYTSEYGVDYKGSW